MLDNHVKFTTHPCCEIYPRPGRRADREKDAGLAKDVGFNTPLCGTQNQHGLQSYMVGKTALMASERACRLTQHPPPPQPYPFNITFGITVSTWKWVDGWQLAWWTKVQPPSKCVACFKLLVHHSWQFKHLVSSCDFFWCYIHGLPGTGDLRWEILSPGFLDFLAHHDWRGFHLGWVRLQPWASSPSQHCCFSLTGVAISSYAKYCHRKLQKAALTGAKKVCARPAIGRRVLLPANHKEAGGCTL